VRLRKSRVTTGDTQSPVFLHLTGDNFSIRFVNPRPKDSASPMHSHEHWRWCIDRRAHDPSHKMYMNEDFLDLVLGGFFGSGKGKVLKRRGHVLVVRWPVNPGRPLTLMAIEEPL